MDFLLTHYPVREYHFVDYIERYFQLQAIAISDEKRLFIYDYLEISVTFAVCMYKKLAINFFENKTYAMRFA